MESGYSSEISRQSPGAILFLLDQSSSMAEEFAGESSTQKAKGAADAINHLLANLVIKCTKNIEEGPRNYFDVGVLGYGGPSGVGPCLGGSLAGRKFVSIEELANSPLRVEDRQRKIPDGAGGVAETKVRFPIWFDPVAHDGTPMCEALSEAAAWVEEWVEEHADSYPPIVVNITDGEATDGDPVAAAAAVRQTGTNDGDSLLYNVHLSKINGTPTLFPASESTLPDRFARQLFAMSSVLPPPIQHELQLEGYSPEVGARGFVFNADAVALIEFLDIGTRLSLESGV